MNSPTTTLAYAGCYTTPKRNGRGKGINVYRISAAGDWTHEQLANAPDNPSFLHMDAARGKLYAVHGDGSVISTYSVDGAGHIVHLSDRATQGTNPVHLTPTPDGRWMVVPNYASGNVVSLPIGADGVLGEVAGNLALPGERGPHPTQQKGSHPHMTRYDPSGRWLLVPDKGYDRVFTLAVDAASGALSIVSTMVARPGAGPRHLAFHPTQPWVYVVGELDATLIFCRFDPNTGALDAQQVASCMPEGYDGEKSSAGIVVSPDGKHVYVSNRADDTVAVFAVDPASGRATLEARRPSIGAKPRFVTLGAAGQSLLVANEGGDNIYEFPLAGSAAPVLRAQIASPVCVVYKEI